MRSGDIEKAVVRLVDPRKCLILPNASWGIIGRHEADLLVFHENGNVTEIEIKVSMSDLRADFKKGHDHSHPMITRLFYAIPEKMYEKAVEIIPEHRSIGIIIVSEKYGHPYAFYKRGAKHATKREQRSHMDPMHLDHRPPTDKDVWNAGRLIGLRLWNIKRQLDEAKQTIKQLTEKS